MVATLVLSLGSFRLAGVIGVVGICPEAKLGNPRAIREVVLHSTRHVLTTTFTTTIGFVPLLLGGGGFWPPLAVVIAGGIFGATLLALYFVPCSYLLIKQKKPVRLAFPPPQ